MFKLLKKLNPIQTQYIYLSCHTEAGCHTLKPQRQQLGLRKRVSLVAPFCVCVSVGRVFMSSHYWYSQYLQHSGCSLAFVTMWLPACLGSVPVSKHLCNCSWDCSDGEKTGNFFVSWPQAHFHSYLGRRVFFPKCNWTNKEFKKHF